METRKDASYLGLAPLTSEQLAGLRALEQELGVVLIALTPSVPLAKLQPEQIRRLQAYEQRTGVILLACQK